MSDPITAAEWAWRRWFLGEGEFHKHGRRKQAVRGKTGAPREIPDDWWERLEEFVARRDVVEPPRQVPVRRRVAARFPHRRADGALLVSEHFRVAEFNCRDGTVVPRVAVSALARLAAQFLEPIRDKSGPIFVTSGYRHRAYNTRIGGARFSQHIYDLTPESVAADIIPLKGTVRQWARLARQLADKRGVGGVGDYVGSGFVHVDNGPRRDWSG